MPKLLVSAVPSNLRELLKDYPDHVERLRDVLERFVEPKPRLQPYDEALWLLEDVLSGFITEATTELKQAEVSGDSAEIERANAKRELMFLARSRNGGLGGRSLDELWDLIQANKGAFE